MVATTGAIVLLTSHGLANELMPLNAFMDHTIDGAPVREAANVTIVDKEVDLELATEVVVVGEGLLRIVTIYGIELDAALATPVDGIVEQLALAHGPQDELVTLLDEHAEGLDGEGLLGANLRVFMFDDRSVEIDCNGHKEN